MSATRRSLKRPHPPSTSARNGSRRSNAKVAYTESDTGSKENNPPEPVPQKDAQPEEHALDDANLSDDEEGGTRIGDIYIPPPMAPYCSMESKGARLIIKKIVNNNFKSYAGRVVLGPFHHCFTSIIGPNGSGKSNVIDSMLFVFGYRANKIRCKKLSTLLHNSAAHSDVNMCSVAVHFREVLDKENGECEEIEGSDLVVERTAFKDNSSFYTINGRRVQFKEVSKLLKQHKVDLDHNRFLILQGEVESIAMMKPKGQTDTECGMLEYLEDIVGTTRYKEPLVKINDRVEQLTDERTEKHNRCKLAEREMKDLEEPFQKGIDYLKQENVHTRTKNLHIQKDLRVHQEKLDKVLQEREDRVAELKAHDESHAALLKERAEKEALVAKELKQFDNLQKERLNIEKKLLGSKKKFTEIQQVMTTTNKHRKDCKAQLETQQHQYDELLKAPDKNKKEVVECEAKEVRLKKEFAELEEELQKQLELVENERKPLVEKLEVLSKEKGKLQTHVSEAKNIVTLAEKDLNLLKQEENSETRKYETNRAFYEENQNTLVDQRKRVQELQNNVPEIQKEIATKTQELLKLEANEKAIRGKLKLLQNEINERQSTMQSSRSNNKVLDFLMRQKNEGKIPGILGRLGDLGAIDAKYDVAISTACGGRMDNIVVETVDDAQKSIEYLKRYDVGRASFIALEKVAYLANSMGRIQTPENAPRMFDLVRVEDERLLPCFYFAIRNLLVATDLDQGSRIAYGRTRFRVVTLKGELIEIAGTMSGGGRTQARGKMGTKVQTKTRVSTDASLTTQKALDDMQVEAEKLQSNINYNQEEQGRLEKEIQMLRTNLQRHETDIKSLNRSIKTLEEQMPSLLKALEKQKTRMQQTVTDPKQVQKIEDDIKKKREKLDEAEAELDVVVKKMKGVNDEMDKLCGTKLRDVENKKKKCQNQLKAISTNISKLKSEASACERNTAKAKLAIEKLIEDIEKAQNDLKEQSVLRQKFDDETVQFTEELTKAEDAIKKAKSESTGVEKDIETLKVREQESNLKRIDIDDKVKSVSKVVTGLQERMPKLRDKLKPLKLNPIPNDPEPLAPLKEYTPEELEGHTLHDLQYREAQEEESLANKPNLSCIEEYQKKYAVYLERVKIFEEITTKRNEMRSLYDDVRKKRCTEFNTGYKIIRRKLKEMYQMITQGGDADLELIDSMDPFTEGVSFTVRPPKKTWKNISNLSGGEKTLSSLALVFALHYYKPSPLYFMDEIDAALDFKNVSIVAHYIKERTKNSQFIIISLRSNMFELSNYLVGIYKVNDCTDSITIENKCDEEEVRETQFNPAMADVSLLSQTIVDDASATIVDEENVAANTQMDVSAESEENNSDEVFKRPLPPQQDKV